ncbi:pectate lyase A [Aspergillus egyptiacus]|nr:pectate lyase A [Aspergillus egyptiacus]
MVNIKFLFAVASCLGPALAAPVPCESQTSSVETPAATTAPAAPVPTDKVASDSDAAFGFASLNGGTTGGAGGPTTTVSSYDELAAAVEGDEPKIVIVSGTISEEADQIDVGSNTSILGADASAVLDGFGLRIKRANNVIIRNLGVKNVKADNGDAIAGEYATNVWIDHCDVSSNRDEDKDYYDGLLDFKRASDYITISNTFIHDHYKSSLIGHSDSNAEEDEGKLRVTYANNYWLNLNSRAPSIRFGTAHLYNNYYENVSDAVNARIGAQVLVESNVFSDVSKAVVSRYSDEDGYAVVRDNDLGDAESSAPEGSLTSVEYEYELLGAENVKAAVVGTAGQTLSF